MNSLNYYTMVNKKLIDNFNKMDFEKDEIVVILVTEESNVIAEVPLLNLEITNTKDLWKLKASPSIFKDVEISGFFWASIINKTVDNTIIMSTILQRPPTDHNNDVEVFWNNEGIIHLNKV